MHTANFSAVVALAAASLAAQNVKPPVNVTVSEGTSMSVAVSPGIEDYSQQLRRNPGAFVGNHDLNVVMLAPGIDENRSA